MSVKASSWAWEQDLPGNEKLVLLALADAANDDGECWRGQVSLATKVGTTDRSIRENMRRLKDRGLIRSEERRRQNGSRTSDLTVLVMQPEDSAASAQPELGSPDGERRGHRKPTSGPEPSEEPLVEPSAADGAREATGSDDLERDAVELLRAKRKVDGRVVTGREMEIAKAGLAEFNRQSGKRLALGPQRHLSLLVGRARDHPTWGPDSYVRAVQAAFRDPWWERPGAGGGGLKLGHVFGEGAFERIVEEARDGRDGSPRKRFVRPGHDHRVNEHA